MMAYESISCFLLTRNFEDVYNSKVYVSMFTGVSVYMYIFRKDKYRFSQDVEQRLQGI